MIAHQRWHQPRRERQFASRAEVEETIHRDFGLHRRALFAPVGHQSIQSNRVDHGAGQNVRARLRSLLKHHDGNIGAAFGRKLLDADGGCEARWPRPDDDHVEFHPLPLRESFFACCHSGPASMCRIRMPGAAPDPNS
jgi:hypothetical protein